MSLIAAIVLSVALACGAGAYFFSNQKDSMLEQMAEDVIKHETGLDIDFSPDEPPH